MCRGAHKYGFFRFLGRSGRGIHMVEAFARGAVERRSEAPEIQTFGTGIHVLVVSGKRGSYLCGVDRADVGKGGIRMARLRRWMKPDTMLLEGFPPRVLCSASG